MTVKWRAMCQPAVCLAVALTLSAAPVRVRAEEAASSRGNGSRTAQEPPLQLRLSSHYAMAPAYVRALVRVLPHQDNRALHVAIDGDTYYRSSAIPLEGAAAARTHYFDWKSLPAGSYEVRITTLGPDGPREQLSRALTVFGHDEGAPMPPSLSRSMLPESPPTIPRRQR